MKVFKPYVFEIFLIAIILFLINACTKETHVLKQPPLLATKILGKWSIKGIKNVQKNGDSKERELSTPIPVYNFLPNGFCATNNLTADVLSYMVKNDTVINFSGDLNIQSHQYTVKIIPNNSDTTMQWIGYPPFKDIDDANLDHIVISFNRIP